MRCTSLCPTGTVAASLSRRGEATYEITSMCVGTHSDLPPAILEHQPGAAFVFGSLAQRSLANRGVTRTHLL